MVVGKQGRMAARVTAGAGRLDSIVLPGRYEVLRHIADGGMASVWCTRDRVLGREIAIKLLADAFAADDVAVRRFEREARAAARVSGHRHVASIYDVGEAPDGVPFIAMEYLAGGSVHDALRAGPVEPKLALRWLRDTSAALDYAHSRGCHPAAGRPLSRSSTGSRRRSRSIRQSFQRTPRRPRSLARRRRNSPCPRRPPRHRRGTRGSARPGALARCGVRYS